MSAPILTEFGRDPYNPATLFSSGVNGDTLRRETRGQLWERVAERATDYSARSTRRLAGRQAGLRGTTARWAHPGASGIIRAGKLVTR